MLTPLKPSEFDSYIGFAYELALDPARSGYPTWCDGIKTREDFIARAKKTLERPYEEILLFVEDGQVEGWIAYEHLEADRYLHSHVFNIRRDTGAALAEFVDYCRGRWPGSDLDLGFPAENVEALTWLEGTGIPCIEHSWNYQAFLDGYTPLPDDPEVRRVTAEDFEEFSAVHRKIDGDMYWNCERVRERLDDWLIFITGAGDAAGELLLSSWQDGGRQEIFALSFADGQYREGPFRALLAAGLNALKERGVKYLTFFVDDGEEGGDVLTELGFQLVGGYAAFRVTL